MQIEDLQVYNKLFQLALSVDKLTLDFPKHELYELGSQMRRSSNSAPANLAEGFGNKHTNIYTESISRSQGEIKETIHHLKMANSKGYLKTRELNHFVKEYEVCLLMLYASEKSLYNNKRKPLTTNN